MKYLFYFITNLFVCLLSFFIPRNRKLAIVGGWKGTRFADNSKYFFIEYYNSYNLQYDLWWITRDICIYNELKGKGYNVLMCNTWKSFWVHMRAKYHIIDQAECDIMGWTSFTATRINLWHGIPIKKIWRAQSSQFTVYISNILGDNIYDNTTKFLSMGGWKDFRLLIPSEEVANENFRDCISNRQLKRAIYSPYPRVSFLRNNNWKILQEDTIKLNNNIEVLKSKGCKIAIYMPTFRDTQKVKTLGASSYSEIQIFNDSLKKHNITLFIKPHPEDKAFINLYFSNIIMISSNIDIYPILKVSDCLITDYSSIFFDYLVLNKPILFYVFDYEYYRKNDRGIIVDFISYHSGTISFRLDELCTNIINEIHNDSYSEAREALSKKIFDFNLPNLHERIITNNV